MSDINQTVLDVAKGVVNLAKQRDRYREALYRLEDASAGILWMKNIAREALGLPLVGNGSTERPAEPNSADAASTEPCCEPRCVQAAEFRSADALLRCEDHERVFQMVGKAVPDVETDVFIRESDLLAVIRDRAIGRRGRCFVQNNPVRRRRHDQGVMDCEEVEADLDFVLEALTARRADTASCDDAIDDLIERSQKRRIYHGITGQLGEPDIVTAHRWEAENDIAQLLGVLRARPSDSASAGRYDCSICGEGPTQPLGRMRLCDEHAEDFARWASERLSGAVVDDLKSAVGEYITARFRYSRSLDLRDGPSKEQETALERTWTRLVHIAMGATDSNTPGGGL